MAALINEMGKRKNDDDNDSLSSHKKPRRVVWSADLHAKFLAAVNELGLHEAVPKKIVTLMNVQGITTAHVASHLQKYRLRLKKAAAHNKLPSTLTQSQNTNIHPSYNFPPVHQSHTDQFYSPPGFNMCGVSSPSTLIQSQNINNNSLNIHPPPSTFPTHSQNIHPSYNFPANQNSTLLLPNNMPLHQSHTTLPNPEIYSPTGFNISGLTPSTLIRQPTQSQNINDSSSIIHPIYHQHTSTFPTLVNRSTTPLGFATTFDFHDVGTFVGSSSSKSTSIWDYDWHQMFMKRKPESLQFSHNSLPVLESDINNSHNVEPFTVGPATSLEDKNMNIWCNDDTPIDFSVEETDPNTLEDIRNMGRFIEDEDLINAWRCFQEEDVTNVMHQPSCY